jgi:hypothetical protein
MRSRLFGILRAASFVVASLSAGCGLFEVREAEPPLPDQIVDPLGFAGLLDSTPEAFTRLIYEDLFDTSFVYEQWAYDPYDRTFFTGRLREIESEYPTIKVVWELDSNRIPLFTRVEGTTVELDSATYSVYLTGDLSDSADYEGYADLGLKFLGYWAISYWYDFPKPTPSGYSFFHPEFQNTGQSGL